MDIFSIAGSGPACLQRQAVGGRSEMLIGSRAAAAAVVASNKHSGSGWKDSGYCDSRYEGW